MNNQDKPTQENVEENQQIVDDTDRESNWEDASQQSQDDVIFMNYDEMTELEKEIFDEEEHKHGEDEEDDETKEKHPDMSKAKYKYHMDSVYKLAISPIDPNFMVSGGGDDIAVIWNLEDPVNPVNVLEGHKDTVDNVAFNFDGKLIATGSMDSTVIIWEAATGKQKYILDGPGGEITFVDFHQKGNAIIAGSSDSTVWMWNASNGTFVGALTGHEKEVTCGSFSPDGKFIISGSNDATLKVWNPKSFECVHTIKGHGFHEEGITSLAFQAKNPIVGTTSLDKTVCLANWNTGKVLGRTVLHEDSVESVIFPHNLDIFITGSIDGKVRVFDSNQLNLKEQFPFESGITKVDYNNEKNLVVISTIDGFLYVFDHRTSQAPIKLSGNNECINDFKILSEDRIIAAGDDGKILLFDIRANQEQIQP